MFYRTLKTFIIAIGCIPFISNSMMITDQPADSPRTLKCNQQIKSIYFQDNSTLSVKTDSIVYTYDVERQNTETSSTFNHEETDEGCIETNAYVLTVFANTLYIRNKMNNITTFITHGSKIKDAFFTPDQKQVIIISPQKISICGLDGTTSFSRIPQNGQHVPDEWFIHVAVNKNSSKIAMSTSKNNVHIVDISNIAHNDSLVLKEAQNSLITNGPNYPILKKVKPWYQRWWKKIKRNKWKSLAVSATSIAAGITLYRWWKK
ncbi:MAG: hypothetical protein WD055_00310 [Candidatus Dependentiae bacterium]